MRREHVEAFGPGRAATQRVALEFCRSWSVDGARFGAIEVETDSKTLAAFVMYAFSYVSVVPKPADSPGAFTGECR